MRYRLVLLALCLLLPAWVAQAAPVLQDLAVYTDDSGELTIEQVADPSRAEQFQPLRRGFSGGYDRGAHWLRFTLSAPAEDAFGSRALMLLVEPSYLEDLRLHILRDEQRAPSASAFERLSAGTALPLDARDFPHRVLAFPVEFQSDEPLQAYLRLQTRTSALARIKALAPGEFVRYQNSQYLLIGLYVGLLVAAIIGGLWQKR